MKKYTKEELQKILDNHKLWLFGKGGKRADLSDADLSYANLSRAYLSNANLSNANLIDANLRQADLSCVNLSNADLSGADLYGADLYCANLTNATFSNTLILGEPVNRAPVQFSDLPYNVLITNTMMAIGCQIHSIDEWLAFTVEEINEMDRNAKDFYKKYGKIIKAAVRSHRVPKEENKES